MDDDFLDKLVENYPSDSTRLDAELQTLKSKLNSEQQTDSSPCTQKKKRHQIVMELAKVLNRVHIFAKNVENST